MKWSAYRDEDNTIFAVLWITHSYEFTHVLVHRPMYMYVLEFNVI